MKNKSYVKIDVDAALKFRKKICQTADAIDCETRIKPTSSRKVQLTLMQLSDDFMDLIVKGEKL